MHLHIRLTHQDLPQHEFDRGNAGNIVFPKPTDMSNDWFTEKPPVRQVVRRISSTFWFMREVLPYSSDCVVISPESVRSLMTKKLVSLCHNYGLEIRD